LTGQVRSCWKSKKLLCTSNKHYIFSNKNNKKKRNKKKREKTNVEIRRVAFDANFNMLGLNLAVKLLGVNIWW
jgi:hypothetical protein